MSPSPDRSAACSLLCGEEADEAISDHPSPSSQPILWPPPDGASIAELIDAESRYMPEPGYLRRCRDRVVDITARLDAVNWILKVQAFYQFQPVTAFLSINYMDRFLSRSSLPRSSSGWAFQLLSVACLSVAAKIEEAQVPLLLDLQVFEPRFVFEPKTVQRMELWLMSNLSWTLRSVTPFDYLHYFFNNLPSSSSSSSATQHQSMKRLFSTASDLILATTRVIDFLAFAPSTVAAAAVLCSAGHAQSPFCFHHRVDHEMVRRCHQLMEEYVVDTCPASIHKATRSEPQPPPPPESPVGVLDAATCVSCDTRSDRNYLGSTAELQPRAQAEEAEAEAEPSNKRLRSSVPEVQQR